MVNRLTVACKPRQCSYLVPNNAIIVQAGGGVIVTCVAAMIVGITRESVERYIVVTRQNFKRLCHTSNTKINARGRSGFISLISSLAGSCCTTS